MTTLTNVVSIKIHLGQQKFVSVDADYEGKNITQLTYNVYKQYGRSMSTIGSAVINSNGLHSGSGCDLGFVSRRVKERIFGRFENNLSDIMSKHIKTIIKGV